MSEEYSVILVYSVSHALRAEKALAAAGVGCKLIPVPRHLSSDCGVCVRIARASVPDAERALESTAMEVEGIHSV